MNKLNKYLTYTSKSGAIEAEIAYRCEIYKAGNKRYRLKEVREEVEKEAESWEEGLYEVHEDFGIRFIG